MACKSEINLESYKLTEEQLADIVDKLTKNEPELFYLETRYRYTLSSEQLVKLFMPIYRLTGNELAEARKYVESETDKIIATLPAGLDEFETALYFHDYICVNFEYDTSVLSSDTAANAIHDIYNMFLNRKAVCQGYSLLYDALLGRVGIETSAVISDSMNHMWNQVKLDGTWYHIDVTWDDPLNDLFGRARHEYFLLSDEGIAAAHETTDFNAVYESSDTTYDNAFWAGIDIPFGFAYTNAYCINEKTIRSVDIVNITAYDVYTIDSVWNTPSGNYYVKCFSGFGSYSDKLIFNTPKEVKYLDPQTMEVGTAVETNLENDNIYAMYLSGDTVCYMYSGSYSSSGSTASQKLVFDSEDPDPEIPGDESDSNVSDSESSAEPDSSDGEPSSSSEPEDTSDENSDITESSSESSSEADNTESEESDNESSETSSDEISTEDSGTEDSGTEDSGTEDSGTEDSSTDDSNVDDSNEDSIADDSSIEDSNEDDASKDDSCTEDLGKEDLSADTSKDTSYEAPSGFEDVIEVGDVNADGAVDQFDYLLVKRDYFDTYTLSDEERQHADVNFDETVDQFDYILLKRVYFGTYTIV